MMDAESGMTHGPGIDRRRFGATAGALAAGVLAAEWPAVSLGAASGPPQCPSGIASGDVTHNSAVVWGRCDRAATMFVEYSVDDDRPDAMQADPVRAEASSDFTARVVLSGLPSGRRIVYRVWFRDDAGLLSPSLSGSFQTAPAPDESADVFFAWSGDTAGQGFGINPEWGGYRMYEAMRRQQPQFFVHSGDHIYADVPLPASLPLADGSVWVNVVTPAKSHPAVTLDDFRGNYAYNLLDDHVRRFNAEVPMIPQWDDHETTNNWYPDQQLSNRKDGAAYEGVATGRELAARARQAFFEYVPIHPQAEDRERIYRTFRYGSAVELFVLDQRSYRTSNSTNISTEPGEQSTFLGQKQLAWLKKALANSTATWKVICSDMPVGLVVVDSVEGKPHFEGIANANAGKPAGRELEFADLFRSLKQSGVKNVIWITADVHYAAAHHYAPERAGFGEPFEPFWEFIAGPLHAGTFGPGELDATFGPEVKFQWAPKAGMTLPTGRVLPADFKRPLPPSDGMQSFGTVRVDGKTKVLTVEFRDVNGDLIHDGERPGRMELQPA